MSEDPRLYIGDYIYNNFRIKREEIETSPSGRNGDTPLVGDEFSHTHPNGSDVHAHTGGPPPKDQPDGKRCSVCKQELPLASFYRDLSRIDGHRGTCRSCSSTQHKQWAKENKEHLRQYGQGRIRSRRSRSSRVRYSLPRVLRQELIAASGGSCTICGNQLKGGVGGASVDHDHASGKIRGVLCSTCNLGLGHFRDNIESLLGAISYLAGGVDKRFLSLFLETVQLAAKKQHDYGNSQDPFANITASQEFGIAPWIGSLVRANDKMSRLANFIAKGTLLNESVEDSLRDLSAYAIIALVLWREQPDTVMLVDSESALGRVWDYDDATQPFP